MRAICTVRRAAVILCLSRSRVDQLIDAERLELVPIEADSGEAAPRLLYCDQVAAFAELKRPRGNPNWRKIDA